MGFAKCKFPNQHAQPVRSERDLELVGLSSCRARDQEKGQRGLELGQAGRQGTVRVEHALQM